MHQQGVMGLIKAVNDSLAGKLNAKLSNIKHKFCDSQGKIFSDN